MSGRSRRQGRGHGHDHGHGQERFLDEDDMLFSLEDSDIEWTSSAPSPSAKTATQLRGQMTLDLVKMLESGDGADVEIKVPKETGGKVNKASYTKKVHKGILMGRSPVFSKMFAKESKTIEAQTGKVVIKDLSPKGLDIFLHYLYTGEVLAGWVHVFEEIINAAEQYGCGELKQYCGDNLLPAVTTSNALKMYKFAKLHNFSFAIKGIMEFIHRNAKTAITEDVIDQVVNKVVK